MLTLGETASDVLCIERAFFGLAVYSEERGLYVEAERDYHRALRLSNQLGIAFETGRALNALGGVAQYVGEFEKSHQYASQYLDLMETHGHQSRVCHALISVGESLISLKAYTEAERNLQRAVRMCRALGLQRLLGVGLLTLGSLAIEQDQLEVAQTYLQEGLLAVRAVGVQRQVIDGLTRLGYLDLRHQDFAGALDHLHEALAIALDVGNPRYLCDVQLQLAQTYLALDDLSAARSALQTSLHITHSLGSHPRKVRNLSYVIAYCECLGQYERAANWAGTIIDEVMIDRAGFATICARLEATLGRNRYEQELEEGKERPLDGALSEALAWLA
jgi:tetratricopeptide (TPR) repeat protein